MSEIKYDEFIKMYKILSEMYCNIKYVLNISDKDHELKKVIADACNDCELNQGNVEHIVRKVAGCRELQELRDIGVELNNMKRKMPDFYSFTSWDRFEELPDNEKRNLARELMIKCGLETKHFRISLKSELTIEMENEHERNL
jgi:hypothetical protein